MTKIAQPLRHQIEYHMLTHHAEQLIELGLTIKWIDLSRRADLIKQHDAMDHVAHTHS